MFDCTLKSSKLLGLFGPADCPYWSHQYLKAIFLRVRHLRKNRPNPLPTKKVDSDAEKKKKKTISKGFTETRLGAKPL